MSTDALIPKQKGLLHLPAAVCYPREGPQSRSGHLRVIKHC